MAKVSNVEIYDRLNRAFQLFGAEDGETDLGDTALRTIRKVITGLQLAIVAQQEGLVFTPSPQHRGKHL